MTTNAADAYRAAAETCALALLDRGVTVFAGPDATRFLQGMLSCDVAGIPPGDAHYALLLTPKAHVVADLRLRRVDETTLIADHDPAAADVLRRTLTRYRLASKLTIDPAPDTTLVRLLGPATSTVLGVPVAGHEGAPLGACAGLDWFVGAPHGVPCADALAPRRLETSPIDGVPVLDRTTYDAVRIEAALPQFGAELSERIMPAEAGVVERAVAFDKGCYIGQEPVARLHYRGHANRGLRVLELDDLPPPSAPVAVGEREVGWVTSAVRRPDGRVVALAYVRRDVDSSALTVTAAQRHPAAGSRVISRSSDALQTSRSEGDREVLAPDHDGVERRDLRALADHVGVPTAEPLERTETAVPTADIVGGVDRTRHQPDLERRPVDRGEVPAEDESAAAVVETDDANRPLDGVAADS